MIRSVDESSNSTKQTQNQNEEVFSDLQVFIIIYFFLLI